MQCCDQHKGETTDAASPFSTLIFVLGRCSPSSTQTASTFSAVAAPTSVFTPGPIVLANVTR
jgi:hypothetical protein